MLTGLRGSTAAAVDRCLPTSHDANSTDPTINRPETHAEASTAPLRAVSDSAKVVEIPTIKSASTETSTFFRGPTSSAASNVAS
jgi:hypothetical protein